MRMRGVAESDGYAIGDEGHNGRLVIEGHLQGESVVQGEANASVL